MEAKEEQMKKIDYLYLACIKNECRYYLVCAASVELRDKPEKFPRFLLRNAGKDWCGENKEAGANEYNLYCRDFVIHSSLPGTT